MNSTQDPKDARIAAMQQTAMQNGNRMAAYAQALNEAVAKNVELQAQLNNCRQALQEASSQVKAHEDAVAKAAADALAKKAAEAADNANAPAV